MGKKSKGNRIQVILECTEYKEAIKSANTGEATEASGKSRKPGISRYVTYKNKKNTSERLELKKFSPALNRMTLHKEIK